MLQFVHKAVNVLYFWAKNYYKKKEEEKFY